MGNNGEAIVVNGLIGKGYWGSSWDPLGYLMCICVHNLCPLFSPLLYYELLIHASSRSALPQPCLQHQSKHAHNIVM